MRNLKKGEGKKIKILCKRCGKEINRYPCQIERAKENFCSNKCKSIFYRKDIGALLSKVNKGKHNSPKMGFQKGHIPWNKLLKYGAEKPKCKICGKGLSGFRNIYCSKHKHLLWTKEKWEKAWEGSKKKVGIMPNNIQREGKWNNIKRGYFNINGKEIFFRSKMEANYALYLDFLVKQKQIKNWEYEKSTFIFEKIKFGVRSYRPDFKVFNSDDTITYHETKGYMTPRSKTQIKRMAKYYPEIKLVIIGKDVYGDIKKKLGKMLKFY